MTQDEINEAYKKYRGHTRHCHKKRDRTGNPVEMRMTFEEWLKVWLDSGRWHERGVGKYVMARLGDIGHYEVGNVKIISSADNIREANTGRIAGETQREAARLAGKRNLGRKLSDETRRKMSLAHQGRMMRPEDREKVRQTLKKSHWTHRPDAGEIRARISAGVKKNGGNKKATGRPGLTTAGLKWWTDGQTEVCRAECPPGFARGRKL